MAKKIELSLTVKGANDLFLNEIADIHAMQKVILETMAKILASEQNSLAEILQQLHARRLQYFNEFIANALTNYETE